MGNPADTEDDVDTSALVRSAAATFTESGASPEAVQRIDDLLSTMHKVVAGQGLVQANMQKLDSTNNQALMGAFSSSAADMQAAGAAAGNQAAAKTAGTISQANANTTSATRLGLGQTGSLTDQYDADGNLTGSVDTRSILYKSMDDYNTAVDRAKTLYQAGEHQESVGLLDVFKGAASVGDWIDAKLINPPEQYYNRANQQLTEAKMSADQIGTLQTVYDGTARANAQTAEGIKAGTLADAATEAAGQWKAMANKSQIDALIQNSANIQSNIQNSKSIQQVAISETDAATRGINFERQFMSMNSKVNKNPVDYANAYNLGRAAMGIPGIVTPNMITSLNNNADEKDKNDYLAEVGLRMNVASQLPPGSQTPNLFGSAGKAWAATETMGAHLLPGSEPVEKWLKGIGATADSFNGKVLTKIGDRAYLVTQRANSEYIANKDNLDAWAPVGNISGRAILAHAAFNTPEMAPVRAALLPLAQGDKPASMEIVADALYNPSLNLTSAQRIQALQTWGKVAAQNSDMTRRLTAYGLPSAQASGWTANIPTTTGLFGHIRGYKNINTNNMQTLIDYDAARQRDLRLTPKAVPYTGGN